MKTLLKSKILNQAVHEKSLAWQDAPPPQHGSDTLAVCPSYRFAFPRSVIGVQSVHLAVCPSHRFAFPGLVVGIQHVQHICQGKLAEMPLEEGASLIPQLAAASGGAWQKLSMVKTPSPSSAFDPSSKPLRRSMRPHSMTPRLIM